MKKKNLVPYITRISGDLETPVTLFKKYVGEDIGFLLETLDTVNGRFSFIGKNPYARIKGKNDHLIIESNSNQEIKKGRLLDLVKDYLSYFEVENETNLPFIGGAIGTIAYDMIRQLERIPNQTVDKINLPDIDLMIITEFIVFDHLHHQIIIVALDEKSEDGRKRAALHLLKMQQSLNKAKDTQADNLDISNHTRIATGNMTKETFMNMVTKAKDYIYEGDIFQVVLSKRWEINIEEHPFTIYRRLRSSNPSPYLYYFNFGDYQVVGSSPEMLVKKIGTKIYTTPIAGTRKRGNDEKEDQLLEKELLADEKEKAEHVMLVDLARNDMGRVSQIGSVRLLDFMNVKKYSSVMHITSFIEGETRKDKDAFDIIASFLPAGTLSGAPKIRAMEIIEELEQEKRGLYGGAVGYFSFDGSMDTCIAIRTMVIKDDKAYIQAGAGIVADSVPENEYEEINNKVKALIEVVGRLEE